MKVLFLVSGGDSQGINTFLYTTSKGIKDCYAVEGGFKGLIDGKIKPLTSYPLSQTKDEAGAVIKSSRCLQFKDEKYFKIALKNAKKYDALCILGGNGSFEGAKRLAKEGMRTIFIPATIDNDVNGSEYSLGFDSAVQACCFVVQNVMPSMEAFNRCCVFVVMGRQCSAIAAAVAYRQHADYCIKGEKDINYNKISKILKKKHKNNTSSCIILRENIVDIEEFCLKLQQISGVEVRYNIIGHIQRGFTPSMMDKHMAKHFAKTCIKNLKANNDSFAVMLKEGKVVAEKI